MAQWRLETAVGCIDALMTEILQFLLSGLMVGSVFGLVAVGFCLVYSTTEVVNFAQGEFVMLGGMIAASWLAVTGWPVPLVLALAVAAAMLVAMLTEAITFGLSRKPQVLNLTIVTIGLAITIKGAVMMIWGKFPRDLPAFSGDVPIAIFGARIAPQALWIVGISLAVMVAIALFMQRSTTGTAMRAAAADKGTAALMGIPVRRLSTLSFGIAAAIGAVAGVVTTPLTLTSYDHGTLIGLKGFCAAIIGGLGNVYGAFLGGLILGVLEAFAAGLGGSGYQDAAAFLVLIVILLVRPQGLFRGTGREGVVKV
jgi:branched-chain amino acid transport system permease protein